MTIILIIISLVFGFFVKPAYAVDTSFLSEIDPNKTIYVQSGTPINSVSLEPIIYDSPVSQESTENRQASSLKNEAEAVYEINKDVTIELFNSNDNQIETVLTNDQDRKVEAQIDQVDKQGVTTLIISPPQQLKPGKYTLEIIDQTGSKIKQDFIWGVLAINPNKSIYNPDETANLAMAVLNESGEMVCDAKLTLRITDPSGELTELSTENNKIIINQTECNSSAFTLKPDYQSSYKTSKSGKYLMELTGETVNGIYTINDSFEVQSDINFEIERVSATRIYPLNNYPVTINIKANQDFKGHIYDEVPVNFNIFQPENGQVEYFVYQTDHNTKKIDWSVDLQKGESISLEYQYKAPDISPQFYLIGPLQLNNDTDLIYQESRSWQIAADAVTVTITKVGTTNWVVPDNVYSVTVEAWGAGGGGGDGRIGYGGGGGGGGAYVAGTLAVVAGSTYPIVIGSGGSGGTSSGTGLSGANTTFNSTTFVAKGGKGGEGNYGTAGGVGGLASESTGTTKFDGGKGGIGNNSTSDAGGGGGGAAGPLGVGRSGYNATSAIGGTGGAGNLGSGGLGGRGGNAGAGITGAANATGGGGGGGGDNGSNGGKGGAPGGGGGGGEINLATSTSMGANGQVVLTYTANLPPNTPTNTTPTNGSVGVSVNPTLVTSNYSDTEGDSHSASQWQIATNSNFSSVVWDTGTTTAATTINVGYNLSYSTVYYWRVRYQQAAYGSWSSYSNNGVGTSFTTGAAPPLAPSIPILSSPATGATDVPIMPTFETVTTDANNDNLQYELKICTDSGMTANCKTFDQTSSNANWSGQDVGTSAYSSGTTATYVISINDSLSFNTTYYWKTRAKDYSNTNTWSATQTNAYSFTTVSKPIIPTLIYPGTDNLTFFGTAAAYSTLGNRPISVTSADFNGDGHFDLVTTDSYTNNITVFTNTGDGTYSTGVTYPTIGGYPSSVVSTDFNGDDHPDLVTANYSANNITVFINTGSGTFSAGVTYPTLATNPNSVTSADVNGDDQPDLITANYGTPDSVTVFTNKYGIGSSTFSVGVTYPTIAFNPKEVTSADFNDDGKADLATANYWGDNITVFINKYGIGSSTFAVGVTYPTFGLGPNSITSADFNGDGQADLATANYNNFFNYNITVFISKYGIGSSTFSAGVTYPTLATNPNSVTSADVNGDGQADLITANYGTPDSITVFTNTGSGTFNTGVTYSTIGTNPTSVTSADFNSDGKDDLVTADSGSNNISVFTNIYSSNFSLTPTFQTVTTDLNSDYLQYQIKYCTNSAMSVGCSTFDQTNSSSGWFNTDVGTSAYSSGTTASYILSVGNSLAEGTTYYWQSQAIDPAGTNEWSGFQSTPFIFATGVRPNTPTLTSPSIGTTEVSRNPSLSTVATDTNSDNLQYKFEICTDSSMTANCQTFDQTSSNVGWSGQNIGTSAYSSGTTATYTLQSSLDVGTSYFWRSYAIDYSGTNHWSLTQTTPNSFVTTSTSANQAPSVPYLPYVNNTTAQSGQQTPVYGLIDHTPAFSAVFDDPDTSDTAASYQLQIGSDTDWVSAEIWDSTKTAISGTCNENNRCTDIVYGGGTSLTDGSTYYWRIKFWDNSDVGGSWSDTQQFSMNNAPVVSNVVINGNNSINLSENLAVGVSWVSTITDADTYLNLSSVMGKIYRSGLGSTCTLDNNNCYQDASCNFYNCSDNSCSVLCSADLYFFTEATDAGSTFASQHYEAWVEATDSRSEVGSTTSSSTTVDINTMSAFSIGTSIFYGEVFAGSDTGSSNTITTVTNTGNSLINLEITGDYLCTDYPSCGDQTIEPQNQQYKLSTFNYGAGTTLSTSPQSVEIGISKPTQSPSNSFRNLYWGIGIPSSKEPGNYQGATTILFY